MCFARLNGLGPFLGFPLPIFYIQTTDYWINLILYWQIIDKNLLHRLEDIVPCIGKTFFDVGNYLARLATLGLILEGAFSPFGREAHDICKLTYFVVSQQD